MTAQPLYIAWKPDGSELLCLDQSDTISVISAKTCKLVRKHKHSSQVGAFSLWLLARPCSVRRLPCLRSLLHVASLSRSSCHDSASILHLFVQVNEVFWSPDGKLWYLAVGGGAIEVLLS